MLFLPDRAELEKRMIKFHLCSVKASTRRLRLYQWRCYVKFCSKHDLNVFPCTPHKLSLYVSDMSCYMKPSSIKTYIQGVMFIHKVLGLELQDVSHPHLKSTLAGIDNVLGSAPRQVEPLFLHHLVKMRSYVDVLVHAMVLTWITSLLMFRCLLRIGQVVASPHILRRDSIEFTDFGFMIKILFSKTTSQRNPPINIPLKCMPDHKSCVVYWIKKLFRIYPMSGSSPLFSSKEISGLSYNLFSMKFDVLLKLANMRFFISLSWRGVPQVSHKLV